MLPSKSDGGQVSSKTARVDMVNSFEAAALLTHTLEELRLVEIWQAGIRGSETLKNNEVEDDCNHLAFINSCMPGKTWEGEQTPLDLQKKLLQALHKR